MGKCEKASVQMRIPAEERQMIEALRKSEPGETPSRSERVRRLIRRVAGALKTRYALMRPDGSNEEGTVNWPAEPVGEVSLFVRLLLGVEYAERVRVQHPDRPMGIATDMFVDEDGIANKRERNERATQIYRAWAAVREPHKDPEGFPAIYGPAVLFDRRVWL